MRGVSEAEDILLAFLEENTDFAVNQRLCLNDLP